MTRAQAGAWAGIIAAVGSAAAAVVMAWRAAPADTGRAVDACSAQVEVMVDRERVLRGYVQALAVRVAVLEQRAAGTSWPVGVPVSLDPPDAVELRRVGD